MRRSQIMLVVSGAIALGFGIALLQTQRSEMAQQIKGRPVGESVLLDLIRKGMSQHVAVAPAAWPE